VLEQVNSVVEMDCGTRMLQTLRSSVTYRSRGVLFNCVIYTVEGETPVMGETGTPTARLHYGEVLGLPRYREADLTVACNIVPVEANEACPLGEHQCMRLTWAVPAPGDGDLSISVIPISRERILIHVAPDFGKLSVRKGVKALPARYTASVEDRRAMHYYENAFFREIQLPGAFSSCNCPLPLWYPRARGDTRTYPLA